LILIIEQDAKSKNPIQPLIYYSYEEIRRQASESTARYKSGTSKGCLDGVLIAVKDEIALLPFPTSCGTAFIKEIPLENSTVVLKLLEKGAIMIGKTRMHEFGLVIIILI
jgi:Asp-tRNA(Asn)/Glu-tRNA(Gln) amidotransferase A subunit family amidase